ncbi:MAG: thioredoxin family protein [Saprospiraceae bacterium]|nr:thioredoxin family protein [Candidatus Defluviibacterium haderslevense]
MAKGKRCGPTKVYDNGILIKDIVYKNGLLESYVSYVAGKVNCQISADRKTIINQGKLVNIKWSKFYHVIDDRKFMFFDKKSFVDVFRQLMLPEDIAQTLADISALYDGKDVPGKNAVVGGCGSSVAVIDDLGANYKSSDPGEKQKSADAAAGVLNACSSSRNADLTAPFDGKTGDAARKGRIDKARSAMDRMIANCGSNGSNLTSGGLVSVTGWEEITAVDIVIDAATSGEAVVEMDVAAAGFETTAGAGLHTSLPTKLAKLAEVTQKIARPVIGAAGEATGGAAAAEGAAGATTAVAGTTTAVMGAAIIVGVVTVSALIYGGYKLFEAHKDKEAGDAVGAQADADLKAMRESEKAKEKAGREAKNTNPPPKPGGGASTPLPPGMGSENGCERLKGFKKYCDDNGWKTSDCEKAARLFGRCGGDLTEMYVAGDGNISNVGCPQTMSPEDIAKKECTRKGMFALTTPGGTLCKTKGSIDGALPPAVDPNVINPTRGDFSTVFNNTSVKVMGSSAELSSNLKSSTKKTMVVFMDPDCPSCKTMSSTLKSPEVQSAAANVNILVIDGTLAPEVIRDYKISAYPSTMLISNGKVSPMTIGSMSSNEAVNFIKAD